MAKTNPTDATPLRQQLESLAAFEPTDLPVLSLYLNLTPDDRGRDNYDTFVRKVFAERQKAFKASTPERESFDKDAERVRDYLADEVNRASNALAIFACAGQDSFFDAIQLEAPVDDHWLFVDSVPHLYPLARLVDQNPRFAAVLLDTQTARIFVFSLGALQQTEEVTSGKTRRNSMSGSEARYQRRVDNINLLHVKEVVDTLDKVVTAERISQIVVAGDEVAVPMLKEQLPAHLADKLVDVIRLDRTAGDDQVLQATLDALRQKDAETDAERVSDLIGAWQGSGLGVVGPEATLEALTMGQVEELVITGTLDTLKPVQTLPDDAAPGKVAADTSAPAGAADERVLKLSSELITRAQQTGARIRFIENADLLADVGGVGAWLRFRI